MKTFLADVDKAKQAGCRECIYWRRNVEYYADGPRAVNEGQCRKSPPITIAHPEVRAINTWPVSRPDDWCGEWLGDWLPK